LPPLQLLPLNLGPFIDLGPFIEGLLMCEGIEGPLMCEGIEGPLMCEGPLEPPPGALAIAPELTPSAAIAATAISDLRNMLSSLLPLLRYP